MTRTFSQSIFIQVAVKVIPLGGDTTLEDIRNEVMMMKMCQHPNVVHHIATYMKDKKLWVGHRTGISQPWPD